MILIRPYAVSDFFPLSIVIDQVCGDTPWMSTRRFVPTPSWVHALRSDDCPAHRLYIAESGGEIMGWCRSFPQTCKTLPSSVQLGIGLLTQYRGKGVGSELIMNSLEWAKSTGARVVDLEVSLRNSIAIHVFEKCGFQTIKFHRNLMIMSVSLS